MTSRDFAQLTRCVQPHPALPGHLAWFEGCLAGGGSVLMSTGLAVPMHGDHIPCPSLDVAFTTPRCPERESTE